MDRPMTRFVCRRPASINAWVLSMHRVLVALLIGEAHHQVKEQDSQTSFSERHKGDVSHLDHTALIADKRKLS